MASHSDHYPCPYDGQQPAYDQQAPPTYSYLQGRRQVPGADDHADGLRDARNIEVRRTFGYATSGDVDESYYSEGRHQQQQRQEEKTRLTSQVTNSDHHSQQHLQQHLAPLSSSAYPQRQHSTITRLREGVAQHPADTPSMYTDPYEWQSHAGFNTNTTNTPNPNMSVAGYDYDHDGRTGVGFLGSDPYAKSGGQSGSTGANLTRADTLLPGDSISSYKVPAPHPRSSLMMSAVPSQESGAAASYRDSFSQRGSYSQQPMAYPQPFQLGSTPGDDTLYEEEAEDGYYTHRPMQSSGHSRYDSATSAFDNHSPTKSTAVLVQPPYAMAYADNEYHQMRQIGKVDDEYHPDTDAYGYHYDYAGKPANGYYNASSADHIPGTPGLFSNHIAAASIDPTSTAGADKSAFEDEERSSNKRLLGFKQDSLQSQIDKRRRGIGRQRWPIFTWILSAAFLAVFIAELIKARAETGQAIQTRPSINPMIGPSSQFLISFGARFVPCMRRIPALPTTTELACLGASTQSTITTDQQCPIWEICGLTSANAYGQLWRFITPIFIHAGIVHILFNLVVQLTLCAQIEKLIGSPFYIVLYIAGGVGGNLLGANFGLVAAPSVGASGSIYTCIAIELIDLCYNWNHEARPKMRLFISVLFTIVGLALGLLPGLDNFAHIGGMAVGLLGGLLVCPSIHETKRHRVLTWLFRLVGLGLMVAFFVALTLNFTNSADPAAACTWCRYMSCLPVFSQCKNNGLTSSANSSSKRDLWTL